MKKIIRRSLAFLIAFSLAFSNITYDIFAENDYEVANYKYGSVIKYEMTEYGLMYQVDLNARNPIQFRTVWDVLDVIMAGVSWAEMLNDPSLANLGWAVLDTAAILPLLPSSAYFRQGGKYLLKSDEFLKFAKTSTGKIAIKDALKSVHYYNLSDGVNFAKEAAKHMDEIGRYVPMQSLIDVIKDGIKMRDPRGSRAEMYYHTIYKSGKKYNIEVLYDYMTNSIWHFKYTQKAIGPLKAIK